MDNKSIVFDMDGILFDTEKLSIDCSQKAVKKLGINLTYDDALSFIGMNQKDYINSLKSILKNDILVYKYLKNVNNEYWTELRKSIPIKKGAKNTLQYLKQNGYRIGLATSSPKYSAMEKLELPGFKDYFDVIITGDMFEHGKPEPDIYIKACKDMKVNPKSTYAVEDSYNGIKSAFAAKMQVIMIPDLLPSTDNITDKCKYVLNDLTELQNIL